MINLKIRSAFYPTRKNNSFKEWREYIKQELQETRLFNIDLKPKKCNNCKNCDKLKCS